MNRVKTVVLVGHCGADSWSLQNAVGKALGKEVSIISADDAASMDAAATPEHLWLVNRSLGWGYDHEDGIALIGAYAGRENPPRMMLVSNFAEAQEKAVEAGALQGFGKNALHTEAVTRALRDAVGAEDKS